MAKVLYVDADEERTQGVRALFARGGHVVTTAISAERAMLHVERDGDFNAIVVHLILPGIDGAELCRWLQRWSSLASVPRVVFTTPAVRLRLDLAERLPRWLPADVYIHALEDPQQLVEAVQSALCRAEQQ